MSRLFAMITSVPSRFQRLKSMDMSAIEQPLTRAGVARWPARLAHLPHSTRQPPGVGQGVAQEELDLGVGAAQLVGGPPGQGVVHRRVQAQQDAFSLTHVVTAPALTGTESRC